MSPRIVPALIAGSLCILAAPVAAQADGQLDARFGAGGKTVLRVGSSTNGVAGLIADADGHVTAMGDAALGLLDSRMSLARYNASGAIEGAVFTSPFAVVAFGASGPGFGGNGLVRLADGRTVAVASHDLSDGRRALVAQRFAADGTQDASFQSVVVPPTGYLAFEPRGAAARPDGKVDVVGLVFDQPGCHVSQLAVAQLNTDGTLDTGFGTGGYALLPTTVAGRPCAISEGFSVAIAPDGKIVAAGNVQLGTRRDLAVWRLLASGAPDAGFGGTAGGAPGLGRMAWALGSEIATFSTAKAVAVQPDGRIVMTGSALFASGAGPGFLLTRWTANGPDATFNGSGRNVTAPPPGAAGAYADALALTADGRVLAGGASYTGSSGASSSFDLQRYTPDGRLDTSFGSGGYSVTSFGTPRGAQMSELAVTPGIGPVTTATAGGYVGFDGFSTWGLARYQMSCVICSRLVLGPLTSQVAALSAQLGAAGPVGILVQRLDGTTVGRFPLGRHARGRLHVRWPLTADGRRLKAGRYMIRLRALDRSGVKAISPPLEIRVR